MLPDGALTVVPGAGHGLYATDHQSINQHLIGFLSDGR